MLSSLPLELALFPSRRYRFYLRLVKLLRFLRLRNFGRGAQVGPVGPAELPGTKTLSQNPNHESFDSRLIVFFPLKCRPPSAPNMFDVVKSRTLGHLLEMLQLLARFLFLTHVVGCLLFAAARFEEFNEETWADMYGIDHNNEAMLSRYSKALFFALAITSGIGNTPVTPVLILEASPDPTLLDPYISTLANMVENTANRMLIRSKYGENTAI
eukprot:1188566-Prorocentrum_minimum.AAC.3